MAAVALADEAQSFWKEAFAPSSCGSASHDLGRDLAAVRASVNGSPTTSRSWGLQPALTWPKLCAAAGSRRRSVYWIEEPHPARRLHGLCRVAASVSTPVQMARTFPQVHACARRSTRAPATASCRTSTHRRRHRLAARHRARTRRPASDVLAPVSEVIAHLLAATPTAHWLEYVDWMNPLLAEPAGDDPRHGCGVGSGPAWAHVER